MVKKPLNERTVTVKLKRRELCDLLLACTALDNECDEATKWSKLHDKLLENLAAFDGKQEL